MRKTSFLLIFLLASCASVNIKILHLKENFPAQSKHHLVVIYRSFEEIRTPYIEIALLTVKSNGISAESVIQIMQKKAGAVGGSAIVLLNNEGEARRALVIRFTEKGRVMQKPPFRKIIPIERDYFFKNAALWSFVTPR